MIDFHLANFYNGDGYAMLQLPAAAIQEPKGVTFGGIRLIGNSLNPRECPIYLFQVSSLDPREGYLNAYDLAFTLSIYHKVNKQINGSFDQALMSELGPLEAGKRKQIEDLKNASFSDDLSAEVAANLATAIDYIEEITWTNTVISESIYGEEGTERNPYAFSVSSFTVLFKSLPYAYLNQDT